MKTKALLIAVLLAVSNFAWAQGGLGIDNVNQHMDADKWIATDTAGPEIIAQGPIDKFNAEIPDRNRNLVDTNKLKQAYDGQS